jgi:hypothetical protein
MTTLRHSLLAAAATALALTLAPGVQAHEAAAKVTRAKATSAWVTAPQKHNGTGLTLRYLVPKALPVGAAGNVSLELIASAANGPTTVVIDVPAGITLRQVDGSPVSTRLTLQPGERRVLNFAATSGEDGFQMLSVRTERDGLGAVQGVPLPFGTGKVTLKPNGELSTLPSGEKVISLPAK